MSEKPFCYQLFEEMRTTEKLIKDIISSICAKHELSSFAAFVIGDLKRESGQTSKALASRCCVKPSNFTPLAVFLKKKAISSESKTKKTAVHFAYTLPKKERNWLAPLIKISLPHLEQTPKTVKSSNSKCLMDSLQFVRSI